MMRAGRRGGSGQVSEKISIYQDAKKTLGATPFLEKLLPLPDKQPQIPFAVDTEAKK